MPSHSLPILSRVQRCLAVFLGAMDGHGSCRNLGGDFSAMAPWPDLCEQNWMLFSIHLTSGDVTPRRSRQHLVTKVH